MNDTNIISKEEAFQHELPKWTKIVIIGDSVSVETAKEIIFRTDEFLVDAYGSMGGNNKEFTQDYLEESGLSSLYKDGKVDYLASEAVKQELGFIPLAHFHNYWASCNFVAGPNGFCTPEGKICFAGHMDKHPTVEELCNDLEPLAQAFPELKMNVEIYSKEDGIEFLMGFIVKDGEVTITKENMELINKVDPILFNTAEIHRKNLNVDYSEFGLPVEWYEEFASRVKDAVEKHK